MELAVEYKRKHDEEQEKKAKELARQQAAKQSQQIQKKNKTRNHLLKIGLCRLMVK